MGYYDKINLPVGLPEELGGASLNSGLGMRWYREIFPNFVLKLEF